MVYSLCDTDQYKLTMQQLVFHRYSNVEVTYKFKWRNWGQYRDVMGSSVDKFVDELNERIDHLCTIQFTDRELDYLSKLSYFKPAYIDYLRLFKLNRNDIIVKKVKDKTENPFLLEINGPWLNTILFETPILSIISDLLNTSRSTKRRNVGKERLTEKINFIKSKTDESFHFTDFGTRRRSSFNWHKEIIEILIEKCPDQFTGTSNLLFAMKYNITPIGTMAHEIFQAHQQIGGKLIDSQARTLQVWVEEYKGQLGIALSDIMGFKCFLIDFNKYFATLFDGCRHDSGGPIRWCNTLIGHYRKLGIDPLTKTAVFSDGLTFPSAVLLWKLFRHQINVLSGIGTNLTNDVGYVAPQIVLKMTECNGGPVAKISDSEGKGMCEDPEFLVHLKKIVYRKIKNATI